MENFNRFETKVKRARGKTPEVRLSIDEAEAIVGEVSELRSSVEDHLQTIEDLEKILESYKTIEVHVSGGSF